MKILEEFFEPTKILTYIDTLSITAKECNELKIYGYRERKRVIDECKMLAYNKRLPKDIHPRQYIIQKLMAKRNYSSKYNSKTTLRKEIIYAYALLPNDVAIAELLNNNNYTLEHLKRIIEVRKKILFLMKSGATFDEVLIKDIAIYKKIIQNLISLFEKEFNFNNSTIILNRICIMLVTCPSYFESKSHTNTR